MDIEYPVYVLLKDCKDVERLESPRDWDAFEAIDVENNEYDAWDKNGQKLVLIASITRWKRDTFRVEGSGQFEDSTRFQQIVSVSKVESRLSPLQQLVRFVRSKV